MRFSPGQQRHGARIKAFIMFLVTVVSLNLMYERYRGNMNDAPDLILGLVLKWLPMALFMALTAPLQMRATERLRAAIKSSRSDERSQPRS